MATPLTVEEESGTITRTRHPRQGYYAGDFSHSPFQELHLARGTPNRTLPTRLVGPEHSPVPVFPMTHIHVEAAVDRALAAN